MIKEDNYESNCCFCNEFVKAKKSKRIILETKNCIAFPSYGAIAEGHTLIIPKKHWRSLRAMPNDIFSELITLKEHVAELLEESYGQLVEFEHGMFGESSGGCGIDHAHLHLVPSNVQQPLSNQLPDDMVKIPVRNLQEIHTNKLLQDSSYLYIHEPNSKPFIVRIKSIPSQFLRKILANSLNNTNWNWRSIPQNKDFVTTVSKLCTSA